LNQQNKITQRIELIIPEKISLGSKFHRHFSPKQKKKRRKKILIDNPKHTAKRKNEKK